MAEAVKVDLGISEQSLQTQHNALPDKAEQLAKFNRGSQLPRTGTCCRSYRKKVESQKIKIEKKNSEVDHLQKRIQQFEKEQASQTIERNLQSQSALQLQKKIEKLQDQLSEMKVSSQNLKAKLADVKELKVITTEQDKVIDELSKTLEKVEKIKDEAARKVVNLKTELDRTEHEAKEEKDKAYHMLEAVTNELRTVKRALEEVARREKQV
nr:PREDICTED: coiled-coil domain-containing protein 170-like [Latimeria chalumnae]|eukprot:XP_014340479.1 PREDICTED: coiled-coil domain-containing protein 170-like [Latimeria chalumnae]